MKNIINLVVPVVLLFFVPLFVEGESSEEKSRIQIVKEKIIAEKKKEEKKEEKKEKKEEKKEEWEKEKEKGNGKEKEKDKGKDKEQYKEKDKHEYNHDYDHDYVRYERNNHEYEYRNDERYYKERYVYRPDFGYLGGYYYFYDGVPVYITEVEHDNYVYVDDSDGDVYSTIDTDAPPRKIASLYSSVEASYLGKDIRNTYGATAKISANLYYVHFNCFYQNIFSTDETLTIYSINGGLSCPIYNFTLTPFLGAFYIEPLEEARLSYGADLQVKLSDNYMLDFYTINSSYGSLDFNNFSASLNYTFSIFNIGLGYNYNKYAGEEFSGPFARLSLGF